MHYLREEAVNMGRTAQPGIGTRAGPSPRRLDRRLVGPPTQATGNDLLGLLQVA